MEDNKSLCRFWLLVLLFWWSSFFHVITSCDETPRLAPKILFHLFQSYYSQIPSEECLHHNTRISVIGLCACHVCTRRRWETLNRQWKSHWLPLSTGRNAAHRSRRFTTQIRFEDKVQRQNTHTYTHTNIHNHTQMHTHTHNRDLQFRSSAEVQSKFCDHCHQNDKNLKIILVGGGVTWMTFDLSCVHPTFYLPSDGTPCEPQTVLTKLKSHDCWLGRTLKSWHFYFDAASVCDITEGFKSQGFLRYHSAAVSPPCRLLVLTNVWSGVTDTRQQWFHCLIWNAALMLHHSIYKCVFKCVRASVCVCV